MNVYRFKKAALLFGMLWAIILSTGCVRVDEPTERAKLDENFKEEFGFFPSVEVTDIKCKTLRVGDTWRTWLSFSYHQATWDRITRFRFATLDVSGTNISRWPSERLNKNAPEWWPVVAEAAVARLLYIDAPAGSNGSTSSAYSYLWFNAETKTIYWHRTVWQ